MSEKHEGAIGSHDAMRALDHALYEAYRKAVSQIMEAVMEFERTTRRTVDGVYLMQLDVTTVSSIKPEDRRHISIHFLPLPGDVSW